MRSRRGRRPAASRGAPAVVEFVGVPGAGKTTLAADAIAWLTDRGMHAGGIDQLAREHTLRTRVGRMITAVAPSRLTRPLRWSAFYALGVLHALAAARQRQGLLRHVLVTQRGRPLPLPLRGHIAYWLLQLIGRHRFFMATPLDREVLVLDDGFVHRAVALHVSHLEEPAAAQVRSYVQLLPAPTLLVWVQASPQVCARRIRQRGPWRHRPLSDDQLGRYLRNAARVVELAVVEARRSGWRVVEVDNDDRPLEEARAQLRGGLELAPVVSEAPWATTTCSSPASRGPPVLWLPRPSRVSGYVLARLSPPAIDWDTARAVLERCGLRARARATNLDLSRRSRNIVIATDRGHQIIKQYRIRWPVASIAHSHSILLRLEELGVPAPRLVPMDDGVTWTRVDGFVFAVFDRIAGRNRSLDLLRRHDRLRLVTTAGRTLAAMHYSLVGFVPEGHHHLGFASVNDERRHDGAWCEATLTALTRATEVADKRTADDVGHLAARAPAMLDAIRRLEERLMDADLHRTAIHGDFGLHNLLFRTPDEAVPVDFELSRLDWRVNDLVLALSKLQSSETLHAVEVMQAFLGAYAAVQPLTADEVRLLPDAWRLYELQAAVRHWSSHLVHGATSQQAASAIARLARADWVIRHPSVVQGLASVSQGARPRSSATGRGIARSGRS